MMKDFNDDLGEYFHNMFLAPFKIFTSKPSTSINNQSILFSIIKAVSRSMVSISIVELRSFLLGAVVIPDSIGTSDRPYNTFFDSPIFFYKHDIRELV